MVIKMEKEDFSAKILQGNDSILIIRGLSVSSNDFNKVWSKVAKRYQESHELNIIAQPAFDTERDVFICVFQNAGDCGMVVAGELCSELRHYKKSQGS